MEDLLLTLEEQVQPEHTALVIVDPQKDFCASDGVIAKHLGLDVSRVQAAVPRLNRFIQKARQYGVLITWIRYLNAPHLMKSNYRARRSGRPFDMVIEGSDGANWYSELIRPLPEEHIITKRTYDGFEDTELHLLLQSNGIKTLVLTGFATNICVETTARRGYTKGYYIVLVSDCTDTHTQTEYESTLHNIERYFGKVAISAELIRIWESRQSSVK